MSADDGRVIEPELVPAAAAGLATPGAILTRMRNVDADVRALDGEIEAQRARLPASFRRGWAHWRDAWRRFYRDNEGFAARLWPGTLAEVEAFARRLRDWRRAAQTAGAQLVTPGPSRPSAPPRPSLPSVRDVLPDLSPLRELAQAIPNAARALPTPADLVQPARELLEHSPLSARFWESVKPVAIAGAFAVGGLGLLWILFNLRLATMGARGGALRAEPSAAGAQEGSEFERLERLVPMLASRGVLR